MIDDTFEIANDELLIEFGVADDDAVLSALEHRRTGARFETGTGEPFWELELRNAAGYAATVDGSQAAAFEYDRERDGDETVGTIRWVDVPVAFADTGRHGTLAVTLQVSLPDGDGAARWRPTVSLDAEDCTLWRAVFPGMADLHRVGADRSDDRLLLPDGWGANVRDPTRIDRLRSWDNEMYPSGSTTMQFLAFRNGDAGVYLGLHDPDGRPKRLGVESPDGRRALPIRIEHYPEGMGTEQATFDLGFDAIIGCYEGDWHEPADRYRAWALDAAEWTDAGPIVDRDDVPDWFPEVCLWWAPGFDTVIPWNDVEQSCSTAKLREAVDVIEDLADEIPVPTACHWYHWHQIPFDTSYPDYEPAREGFDAAVTDLQTAGIHVMPYINARLADPNSEAWTDRGLGAAAAKPASARLDPRADIPTYEEYGNGQLHAPMCAATDAWRETVGDTVRWLEDDIGVDAVYLDQIAASEPPLCFDRTHDHPAGGGAYGVDAYRRLLTDLSNSTNLGLTTECNAESYMSGVSGYLLWHSARTDSVPLFQTIYGEYTVAFGRHFVTDDLEDDARPLRTKLAQLFDYGAQLGWMPLTVARALREPGREPELTYLRRTATALDAGSAYLLTGRRLPDPDPTTAVPSETVSWLIHHRQEWTVEIPVLLASAWKPSPTASEEGIAVAVTNWTDTERSATWTLPAFDRSDGPLTLTELSDSECRIGLTGPDDQPKLSATVPSRSSAVVRLTELED